MGGHDDPMAVKKNVYVEGVANYRDQIHYRFGKNLRRGPLLPFVLTAIAFPVFLYGASAIGDAQISARQEAFKQAYKMPESRKVTLQEE